MNTDIKIAENISNGLSEGQQRSVVGVLSAILADQHILYMKLRNFHWNLKGPRFHSLHELFEQQYEALAGAIDETAERIRMVGGVSPGSMSEMLATGSLKEAAGEIINGDDAISALVTDQESVIRSLREAADEVEEKHKDQATADFIIELLQKHEANAWMLRSSTDQS